MTDMSPRRWAGIGLGILLGIVVAVVVLPAAPASAHAVLQETVPGSGGSVPTSPGEVTLRYSEPVSVSLGGVRVIDRDGQRVDAGKVGHSGDGKTLSVPLKDLDDGVYIVSWRVISTDSHPIKGAFTFRVGDAAAGDDRALILDALSSEGGGDDLTGGLYAVARFGAFAGLTVLVGGAAFLAVCWRRGASSARARKVAWGAWGATLISTVMGIVAQGPYAAGLPLADGLKPSLIADVLDTRFGTVWALRIVLLLTAVPLLAVIGPACQKLPRWWVPAGAVLGLGLLLTPGLAGHAATGEMVPLAIVSDVVHLGAIAFWLGGLTMLCAALLPERDVPVMRVALPLFSKLAFVAVALILASGTFQSWRQIRELDALTSTTYGKLVFTKLALFAGIIGLAYLSRQVVRGRLRAPVAVTAQVAGPGAMLAVPDAEAATRLRRSVFGEVALAAVVLAVTSMLVNTVPGREALAKPFATLIETEDLLVDVTIEPARTGPNDIHLYTLDANGVVKEVPELEATLSLPAQDLGPLPVKLTRITGDHFSVYGQDIPIPGEWRLDVIARPTEFDQIRASTTFQVR